MPDLPLSSLGLKRGDQLIVSNRPGVQTTSPSAQLQQPESPGAVTSTIGMTAKAATPAQMGRSGMPGGSRTGLDDYVEVDGQVLMLRVSIHTIGH